MQHPYVYIHFARNDRPEAQALIEKLNTLGIRTIHDEGTTCGTEWKETLVEQIQGSHCLLVFLTENSAQSHSFMNGLDFALSRGKEVIAVCPKDLSLPAGMKLRLGQNMVVYDPENADSLVSSLRHIPALRACRRPAPTMPQPPLTSHGWRCTCGHTNEGYLRFCCCCGRAQQSASMAVLGSAPPPAMSCPPCEASAKRRPMPCAAAPSAPNPMPSEKSSAPVPSAPAAKKKSLAERIKSVFGGSKMTDVSFSVLAPATFPKGSYTMIDIYAYEEAFRHVVEQTKAERAKQEGPIKESDGGHLQVRKGARITVRLTSPDIQIADNEESRVWSGKYVKFDFPVLVPQDLEKEQLLFCAAVYFDDVIATNIRFVVACRGSAPQRPKLDRHDVRSAFISYASGDRERVALILQGMRRSRPDLDVFFDVETLKTGDSWEQILRKEIDRRDVLYLCWSKLAKESPWVEKEWRYALQTKGLDGIEPIPLTLPKECPPPEELKSKHFGARELFYQ